MKIAYLSISDPLNKKFWDGNIYYIAKALENCGHEVELLGPFNPPKILDKFLRGIAKFTRSIFNREYLAKCNLLLSWYAAKQFSKKLKGKEYDCICVPSENSAAAFLKTQIPIVYVTDTTFKLITHYYSEFRKIPFLSKLEGNLLEKKALKKSTSVIYSSIWAAESAVHDYNISTEKILIMPMGGNVDELPDNNSIYKKLENRELTLLFIGNDWYRKGGDIAIETLKFLKYSHGIKAKLVICGSNPPPQTEYANVEVFPELNMNKKEDADKLTSLLSNAHFLFVPARADCSLTEAAAANAYGVPAITTETGGIPEIVKDGINGYCLPYTANGNTYAALISELFIDESRYRELISSTRQYFEKNLNWCKWTEGFRELFEKNTETTMDEKTKVLDRV
ncbi:MAG TPA: glycosyltransferase family 4 protein [Parafilimonas sp.]|nr:glycosyltransferase family 4 protein [Parafilimonas sp.]